MEITTYERQASVPNGESEPVVFTFAPDEARFSAGHVPPPRSGFGTERRAYVTGAALVAGDVRPVYSVGTLGLVVHTEPDEDAEEFVAVYGARVREGRVVWSADEWDARCRLGGAWAVRPVVAGVAAVTQADGRILRASPRAQAA